MENLDYATGISGMNKLVYGVLKLGDSLLNLERSLEEKTAEDSQFPEFNTSH